MQHQDGNGNRHWPSQQGFHGPLGFFLGLSKTFAKMFDPIFQVLRPVSPLAWLPLGYVVFSAVKVTNGNQVVFGTSDAAALFTIAVCSMWPTVMNTAVGVRAIPQDYLNVSRPRSLRRGCFGSTPATHHL